MKRILKIILIVYASPNSAIGLFVGLLGMLSGGKVQLRGGCVEFYGGLVRTFLRSIPPFTKSNGMAAMTLGHVIIGQDTDMLERAREHEHVHVRQYEMWGPLFIPIYGIFSFLLWISGRNPYLDNPFEQEAYSKVDRLRQ